MTTHNRLKSWIETNGQSVNEFARRVEYDHSNMHKLVKGVIRPSLDLAFRIERATDGAVPAAAWVERPPAGAAA